MKKRTTLLVDDEDIILKTLGRDLKEKGYNVTTAKSGTEAIIKLKQRNYDLVITDLVMEGLDGLQVLKETKKLDTESAVVILTGYGNMASAIDAMRLGADDFLLKPCDVNDLMFRVARCLEMHDLRRKIKKQAANLEKTNQALQYKINEHKRAEKIIKQEYRTQNIVNELLTISIQPDDLETILDRILGQIVSIPFLQLKPVAAIFLIEENPNELVMKAYRELSAKQRASCSKVPIGHCVCGQVALTKKEIFVNPHNTTQDNTCYVSSFPHGHYCFPIVSSNNMLGVLTLYIDEGHRYSKEEAALLKAICNVLSGIIEHKRTEETLKARQREIEELNTSLEKRVQEEVKKSHQKDLIMMHQARLAAMGEMIGLIAHQWRQPLSALNFLMYNIKISCEENKLEPKTLVKDLKEGEHLILTMSNTIDDFRNFFRPDKKKEPFSINKKIKDSLTMLMPSCIDKDISIKLNEKAQINLVGFPNEYSHVILNILNNAKDAILKTEAGGKITIDISQKADAAIVKIKDNAGGIPKKYFDKIFDPYFTTKPKEKGTGLGLYLSKVIIEEHMGGCIKAKNANKGAEIKIVTPIAS